MTTKPIITLSNIKVHVGLSDETPAYTATILVDGAKFADVENNGTGGCDNYRPVSAAPGQQAVLWDKVKELDARIAATYDPIDAHDMTLTMDLETLCHTLVWEHVETSGTSAPRCPARSLRSAPTATSWTSRARRPTPGSPPSAPSRATWF